MLVKPTIVVADLTTLDLAAVKALGIKGFVFDLDNTLIAPHTGILQPQMAQWLEGLRAEGFQLVCLTNNKRPHYYQAAEKTLGIPTIGHGNKPFKPNMLKAIGLMQLTPAEVAVVGDRPLTDILGGVWVGAYTILCDPLTKRTEPFYIQCLRKLERCFVRPW